MGNHYVDRTTSLDKTYYYRVVLIDKSNNTSVTDAKEITVTQTSLPSIPEEFNSTTHIAGGVWLSWKLDEISRANTVRLYASDIPMDKAENQYFINEISANEATYVYDVTKIPKYYGILIIDADGGESEWITTELQRILPPVGDKITNLEHPYLFFHGSDIPSIKQTIANYEFAENALEVLVANADIAASAILDPKFQLPGKNDNLHDRLADQARDLSLAYLMTEKPEYRDAAIKILTEYGDHYAEYPLEGTYDGRLLYQTLNEYGWVIDFAWAYDMMYQELSEVQRQKIEEDVLHNAVEVISRYKRGLSNWQTWHNAAIGIVGLVTKDQALVERAINDPAHGFKYQMANGIRNDGLWWEESNSYHEYTLEPFIYLAEAAYNSNLDMYSYEAENGTSFKSMFDALLNYIFADLTRPAVGNTSVYSPLKSGLLYEIAYKRYKDPNLASLIQQTLGENRSEKPLSPYWAFVIAEPDLPQVNYSIGSEVFAPEGMNIMGSTLYKDSGMAILRNHDLEGEATNISMTWSPYGTTNGHQHADMLSIMLYGNGDTLLTEAGSLGYSNPNHISWAKQTLAHNTLVVDETSQYPQGDLTGLWDSDAGRASSGILNNFHIGSLLKTIRAESDNVYDGVNLDRTLIMIDDYVIDWFQASSDTEHVYDLPYHVNGKLIDTPLEFQNREESFRNWGGYQHISQIKSSFTDDQWTTTWQGKKGNGLNVTMLGDKGTEAVYGVSLNEMIMARRKAKDTDFVTILQPFSEGENLREVQTLQIQADSPAYAVKIKDETSADMIAMGKTGEMKSVLDTTFDGSIAFAQKVTSGQNHNFALIDGKYYKDAIHEIQLLEEGSVQFTELDRPHTYRLDYSGSDENDLELIMHLHPNTKVMAYDPMTNKMVEHEFTLGKGEGPLRNLEMKLENGMSYIFISPTYNQDLEFDLSAYAVPLYD
ncbi:MAG: alginate lyase family protein, partial [Clostridiales bacterium]|nr:alginate lyase family protein [Clostridiales bacterium]